MTKKIDFFKSDHKQIVSIIKERRAKLAFVSKKLKSHFIGIDKQIDTIISSISTFYCCPELLTRPTIVCLWGPTGTGKTDLVRRLVRLLDFQDRFCEVEMMNKGHSYIWHSTISGVLSSNPKIRSNEPAILLLDEIQNFRTVNEEGHELSEYKYRDIWTLLSDGKLPFFVELDYLLQLLWDYDEKEKRKKNKFEKNEKKSPMEKFQEHIKRWKEQKKLPSKKIDDAEESFDGTEEIDKEEHDTMEETEDGSLNDDDISQEEAAMIEKALSYEEKGEGANEEMMGDIDDNSYYTLKHFKSVLRLEDPIEEIAKWSFAKKKAIIMKKLEDPSLYEEVDYTKMLIFVSGNLDEAYSFSNKTSEVDVDADIFHELSLKINILDIKKALLSRFKPEQIARFGNMQVIYPTLSKKSYEVIIQRKINDVIKSVKNKFGIQIEIDKSINDLVYQNGVFPTQGTRPVFSTISEIVENPLPIFMLQAIEKKQSKIKISYSSKNICASIGQKTYKVPYEGSLDKLKENNGKDINRRVMASVHEAGHAVVYALLFKTAPVQMSSFPTATDVGGFIWTHNISGSEQQIDNKICAVLAGAAAEKIIFGESSWGGQDDLQEATKLAGSMVKRYGMKGINSYVVYPHRGDIFNTDLESANAIIEKTIKEGVDRAKDVLKSNIKLFIEVTEYLSSNNRLTPEHFKIICAKHGLKIAVKKSEEIINLDYLDQYKKFKNNS